MNKTRESEKKYGMNKWKSEGKLEKRKNERTWRKLRGSKNK